MLPFDLPPGLTRRAALGADWATWLDGLPRTVAELVEEWDLAYDGAPRHGACSLVVPMRTTGGRPAALKVGLPHEENAHEHLALRRWQGRGAVLMLRADPRRRALLLERLHEEHLGSLPDLAACEVVAGLYARLHVPAPPQLPPLSASVERWTSGLAALPNDAPMPRRLVEQAVSLAGALLADPACAGTMVHGDLHYENVLAADREPWLAIDPKPLSGDPHYEVAPLLWNRWEEVARSGRARDGLRRRFHTVVDAAGLDEDRARDWVVVRALHNAYWTVDAARSSPRPQGPPLPRPPDHPSGAPLPRPQGRALGRADREWITTMVTVAKAVQD